MSTNRLIDNSLNNTLAECIAKFLDDDYRELCIATGYWDIPGTALIFDKLNQFFARGGKLRLLIGEEPVARQYQLAQERRTAIQKFPDDFIKIDIADLKDEYKPVIKMLLEYCAGENPAIQIRVYGQNVVPKLFLHAKCYIFRGDDSVGIIGSANFTKRGLEDNTELSYLETQSQIVGATPNADSTFKGHAGWFEEKWMAGIPWNMTFRKEILEPSRIGNIVKQELEREKFKITPYSVYIKYLQGIFGTDTNSGAMKNSFVPDLPEFKKLKYQIDAVNRGYAMMLAHHGFILADVVGLGKTVVGLMLINRFLNEPESDGQGKDILIVTPPAVKKAWEKTIRQFDHGCDGRLQSHITIITTGKVTGFTELDEEDADDDASDDGENDVITVEEKQYGLILIDESHKFRNSGTQMYQAMDELIGRIWPQPYVVLLSATPQNNSPRDLKNQIFLFQREPQNTTLETIDGRKLDTYFAKKQREFDEAKRNKDYEAIKALSSDIRVRVLDQLLVRRTRTDIRKFYCADAGDLHFPEISGPHALEYRLNEKLAQLFADTMNLIAPSDPVTGEFVFREDGLSFERYRAIEYLTAPEERKHYQIRNLTPENTSKRLAKIMQILLVKRLESSFSAFRKSLVNLKRYTQNMVDMLRDDCVFICPDINVNAELDTNRKGVSKPQCYEDLRHLIEQKGGNNVEYRASSFSASYQERLLADLEKITSLCDRWNNAGYDPKLQVFLKNLDSELFDLKKNNPSGFDKTRLVIFTEALDTVEQLRDNIEGQNTHRILAITAANRDAMNKTIAANFDANLDAGEKRDDYDVLITTEVLAEGVNLHRANVILNYDTPWNSTRLMQRIGRVNRIGSKEKFVFVYNFMPTAEGDHQIELVNKAHAKLQAFHAMFGEDNQIYTTMEEVASYGTDPAAFRRLVEGDLSPLEPYAAELRAFQAENPDYFDWIAAQPDGMGCAKVDSPQTFCCVAKSSSRYRGLNIQLCGDEAKDISSLEMLELLKCTPETPAVESDGEALERLQFRALAKYTEFMNRMMTAGDGNKKRTDALKAIREIKTEYDLNEDTNSLLNIADAVVRKNDRHLAKRIIHLRKQLADEYLPGMGMGGKDINEFLRQELHALSMRRNSVETPPEITLYMANQGE